MKLLLNNLNVMELHLSIKNFIFNRKQCSVSDHLIFISVGLIHKYLTENYLRNFLPDMFNQFLTMNSIFYSQKLNLNI